jgi:hypothetical protein
MLHGPQQVACTCPARNRAGRQYDSRFVIDYPLNSM